jgi:SLT domain-containing protein
MAVLSTTDRARIHRGLMRYLSNLREAIPALTKADIRAAIDAADSWIDSNQSSYNTALPTAFRTNATTAQKTFLFCAVAAMRVSPAFARAVLGETD